MPPTDLPTILSIHHTEEGGISVYCNAQVMIEAHGSDPALWATALSAALMTVCRSHSACLVNDDGEHPHPNEIYERILDALPDAMDRCQKEGPIREQYGSG